MESGSSEGDDSEVDDEISASTRPRLAKKTVPELGDKETFLSFYVTFRQQVESWKVKEESELFREYFETAIQKNTEAKSEYWNLRARHPKWSMKQVSSWMIKKLDKLKQEEVEKKFERLFQGNHENVSSFLERFSEAVEAYKLYNEASEIEMFKSFKSKLRSENQKHLKMLIKLGLEVESIEDAYEVIDFEEHLP
jgi:hypothetical protein